MDLARLGRIGSLQDGLITRDQALQVLASNQIMRLLDTGVLEAIHDSVYRMTGSVETWRQKVRAATLCNHAVGAIASHRTAAALWGFIEWKPNDIEILCPFTASARLTHVTVHRTRHWYEGIATKQHEIPVTNAARTLIDLSAVSSYRTLESAFDAAITTQKTTLQEVVSELKLIGTRGRKRVSLIHEILQLSPENASKTRHQRELSVLRAIIAAGLPKPVPQFSIQVGMNEVFRPDLVYPSERIAIECQSWRWHGGPTKFNQDIRRKNQLRMRGWNVIEIGYFTDDNEIVRLVKTALTERRHIVKPA